jgi:hypothetical protein
MPPRLVLLEHSGGGLKLLTTKNAFTQVSVNIHQRERERCDRHSRCVETKVLARHPSVVISSRLEGLMLGEIKKQSTILRLRTRTSGMVGAQT